MKRHASLAILSRQHHAALILCQLLKSGAPEYKGLPTDTVGKMVYASQFYTTDLMPHFEAEEKVFATVKGLAANLDELLNEIVPEHSLLRAKFSAIHGHADLGPYLDELGKTLEQHIRKEERQLFPLIEETAGEKRMKDILALLTH